MVKILFLLIAMCRFKNRISKIAKTTYIFSTPFLHLLNKEHA
ncbi:hypothetical protein EUBSIR_01370 [[Eubacterium] siraeum DSM 15702]|uniref:Uncharacterized protein n=1 Tax=[Eubacterium] siraeum DSM 15702 TaxID=428128 RepID=B0MNG5_9FIRM|nr:hypothetical protein EUBSIR_01370 [[Eubacterium] siraeum DSM 15702]